MLPLLAPQVGLNEFVVRVNAGGAVIVNVFVIVVEHVALANETV